jgi:hypothetical protein
VVNGYFIEELSQTTSPTNLASRVSSLVKSERHKHSDSVCKITLTSYTTKQSGAIFSHQQCLSYRRNLHGNSKKYGSRKTLSYCQHHHRQQYPFRKVETLFVSAAGSEVKIIESFVNAGGTENFINNVTEIYVAENAMVEYNKIQDKKDANFSTLYRTSLPTSQQQLCNKHRNI